MKICENMNMATLKATLIRRRERKWEEHTGAEIWRYRQKDERQLAQGNRGKKYVTSK